jgi:hypothetical protein
MPDKSRHRIVTSLSYQQLKKKVRELKLQGWEERGEIAVAKSVVDSEPPYLSQALVRQSSTRPKQRRGR